MIWKYGDQIGWGPFVQGDQIFGDHLSMGTKFDGDRLSRGINCRGSFVQGVRIPDSGSEWGPEVLGSNGLGTKYVAADYSNIMSYLWWHP